MLWSQDIERGVQQTDMEFKPFVPWEMAYTWATRRTADIPKGRQFNNSWWEAVCSGWASWWLEFYEVVVWTEIELEGRYQCSCVLSMQSIWEGAPQWTLLPCGWERAGLEHGAHPSLLSCRGDASDRSLYLDCHPVHGSEFNQGFFCFKKIVRSYPVILGAYVLV